MQGEIAGVALELRSRRRRGGCRCWSPPPSRPAGRQPRLVRIMVVDASERRAYEHELLRARQAADLERGPPGAAGRDPAAHPAAAGAARRARSRRSPRTTTSPRPTRSAATSTTSSRSPHDRWGFFLGDVCGKGAEAAAVTSLVRYTLRAARGLRPRPRLGADHLNTALYRERRSPAHRYCTVVFGVLTMAAVGAEVRLSTGGHPAPLLLRADGSAHYLPATDGPLVGVLADASYTGQSVDLRSGDTLLLYTDGVVDVRRPATGRRYSSAELLAYANRLAPASAASAVIDAVATLVGATDGGLDDDAAVLAIGVLPAQ